MDVDDPVSVSTRLFQSEIAALEIQPLQSMIEDVFSSQNQPQPQPQPELQPVHIVCHEYYLLIINSTSM